MRRLFFVVPILWVCSLAVPLLGPMPSQAQGEEVAVNIVDSTFDPGSIEVAAGTTVTWTNNDTAPHTVTADDGSFDSGTLDPGATFSYTFAQAGSFAYHCEFHPTMTAALEVAAAEEAEPAEPGDATAEAEEPEEVAVNIVDFAFDPGSIEVAAGATVTWTNNGEAPHTVTADDGLFDSGRLEPGDTFNWTFAQAGAIAYHCEFHPDMTAAVEVVESVEEAPDDEEDAEAAEVAVTIANFAFDPGSIEVAAGTTVTWTNNDTAPHTVTADSGTFDSGTLQPGDTFSWTFEQAGSVAYHCAIHPAMTASVEVSQGDEEEPPPPPPPGEEEEEEEAAEPTPTPAQAQAPPPAEEAPAEAQGGEVAVSIANFAFDPAAIDVEVGTTVTWTNDDVAPHTVTADDGSFDSGTLGPGASFSFTFEEAGTFSYFCMIHPNMTASVSVGEAAGDAPSGDTPAAGGEATMVGVNVDGSAAIWIMGKIEQRGENLSLYGYVNHVEGLDAASLFTDAEPANWNESTARITVFGDATMRDRFVLEERIFTGTAEGTLQFFFNEAAGASFATPESFFSGKQIAEAELEFRQTLSVPAGQDGVVNGSGQFTLSSATPFTLDGGAFQLGQTGLRHDMTLNGLGTLTDPAEPRATLEIVARSETSSEAEGGEATEAAPAVEVGDGQLTIEMGELNDSGVSGSAMLSPSGEETDVSVQLEGATGDHPAHIHLGTCETLDPNPEFPLESVAADGTSVTTVPVALDDLLGGEFAINIHESVANIGRYIACGNIAQE